MKLFYRFPLCVHGNFCGLYMSMLITLILHLTALLNQIMVKSE